VKTGGASEVVVNRRGVPRRLSGRRLRACEGAVISFTVWAPAAATVHVVLGTEDALAVQSSKSLARVDRVMAPKLAALAERPNMPRARWLVAELVPCIVPADSGPWRATRSFERSRPGLTQGARRIAEPHRRRRPPGG
jgi:hypothetical protein